MYVFAEPVTEEQADEIQGAGEAAQKDFARTVVGLVKDDPEVQAAWQNIQDDVDEQVDVDRNGNSTVTPEKQQEEPATTAEEGSSNGADIQQTPPEAAEETSTIDSTPDGPLMGWTLTTRSKVNGGYVDRPRKFSEEDEWEVEYHIQEIPEESRWRLYNALKARRHGLVGVQDKEVDKGLSHYRGLIQRFSNRGREWREAQDKLNEEMGVQMYKPLGPGSDAANSTTENATEKAV
jgi:hypothetical protein